MARQNIKNSISRILSAVLAVLIGATLVLGLVSCSDEGVDYINDDLSKYVYISSDDYKNFPVNAPLVSVDETDVQREITRLLVKNKNKDALFSGAAVRPDNYTIKFGDVANIWYRGYTVDEKGQETELDGASNFEDGKPYGLEIGSGTFIKGIEEGLVGKQLHNKSLEFVKSGKAKLGDILYISYNAFLPNGTPTSVSNVKIDVSDKAAVDKTYGIGFANFLMTQNIAAEKGVDKAFKVEGEDVDTVYFDLKIDYAIRFEEEPYRIDVVFPADYHEVSYRGLKATFEIYVSTAIVYKGVPEWNDTFITETLKETAESLSEYEGETLAEKYENKIRAEIKSATEQTNKILIEDEMWKHYLSKVEVKKLPKVEVNNIYRQYLNEAQNYYKAYGSGFASFDEFAAYYFNLPSGASWSDYITEMAEAVITERLTFYYIINKEGIAPSAEEYERIYNECVNEYKEYYKELYKTEIEACKTEEEKNAKLLEIEKEMLEYYGEKYFNELVYYQYALDYLIAFADLK